MSSVRVASLAHRRGASAGGISADEATFASLPPLLACLVFLALPADARGRACCVCRAWRDVLADPSLWTRLDTSIVDVHWWRFLSVFRGAAGRALGQLSQLDLSQRDVSVDSLQQVLTANAGSLRELHLRLGCGRERSRIFDARDSPFLEAVLTGLPMLRVLTVEDVSCTWKDATQMLRAEPPFAVLKIRHLLKVCFHSGNVGPAERFLPLLAALSDAALQPALSGLSFHAADTAQPALMGALVDAALARRLRELKLKDCTPPATAGLARLLARGSLVKLEVELERVHAIPLFDAAPGAALVADALRTNTTLTDLRLYNAYLCNDVGAAVALLAALVGHPSLRELHVCGENTAVDDCRTLGAAFAALIAAPAQPLEVLVCCFNDLGDVGLAPIVEALALNRHLRELDVNSNDMSEEFARDLLLPAVRANTTLRKLVCDDQESGPSAPEAERLVRRRGQ